MRAISADPAAGPGPTPSGEGARAHPHHPRQDCTNGAEPQGSPGCASCHGRRRTAAGRGEDGGGGRLRSRKENRGAEEKLGAEGRGGAALLPVCSQDPPASASEHARNQGARAEPGRTRSRAHEGWRSQWPRGAWEPRGRSLTRAGEAASAAWVRFGEVRFRLRLKKEVDSHSAA